MNLRFGNEDDGHAIARLAMCGYNPKTDVVIARVNAQQECMGGALFQNYTGASIGVHMAGLLPNWASRDLIWCCFDYAFNQLGCHSVFAQVPAFNDEALEIDRRLGFKEIVRIPEVFPDADLIVLRMRKDECEWLAYRPRAIQSNRVTPQGNSVETV